MSQELKATVRKHVGKKSSRQSRREGRIPAVLYGVNGTRLLELEEKDARHVLERVVYAHKLMNLVISDPDSGEEKTHEVLLQEVQKNTYKEGLIHLDFRELDTKKAITLPIPLQTIGDCPGIKKGGVLQMAVRTVPIACAPGNIPEYVELDISNLNFGDTLRLNDISLPEGLKIKANDNYSVASIVGRAVKMAAAEEVEAAQADTEAE